MAVSVLCSDVFIILNLVLLFVHISSQGQELQSFIQKLSLIKRVTVQKGNEPSIIGALPQNGSMEEMFFWQETDLLS